MSWTDGETLIAMAAIAREIAGPASWQADVRFGSGFTIDQVAETPSPTFRTAMKTLLRSLLLVACLLTALPAQAQTRYFVDPDATGNQDGLSWANAIKRLQNALAAAGSGDEIWVAAGTYYPDEGASVTNNDRTASFYLKTGVKIYGGFDGTDGAGGGALESALSQRDVAANTTILSGDIDKDGTINNNSYHVVRGGSANATALLDGFKVTRGHANGVGGQESGAGLFIRNSSPTLRNLTVTANLADHDGAGLFFHNSSSILTQSTVEGNTTFRNGGGIYLLDSSPALTSTTITNNSATDKGGGLYVDNGSNPGVAGLTITDNTASEEGGGIFNQHNSLHVRSTILWDNTDVGGSRFAAQLYNDGATPTVSYSIVENSGGSGADWESGLGSDGGGNLDRDPALGALSNNGGATETQLPSGTSPVIDAGACYGQAEDQRGEARPYDANDNAYPDANDGCDIGAVELRSDEVIIPFCSAICYVDASAGGTGDGLSWANAFTDLQSALLAASNGGQIWVAAGTYYPDEGPGQTDNDPGSTFALISGVAIYGGFAGHETTLEERDVEANVTILSGLLHRTYFWHAYHVVDGSGVNETAILDGFTIRDGDAFGNGTNRENGGGIYIVGGSPTISNNKIIQNKADELAGGIYIVAGSPVIENNVIANNSAESTIYNNGTIYSEGGHPTIANNEIKNNTNRGISINGGDPTIIGNLISNNSRGGVRLINGEAELINNTIKGNTESFGGGVEISGGSPLVQGNLIHNNRATVSGGGLYILEGCITLSNNTITDNTANNGDGGGIMYLLATCDLYLYNNTITGNTANNGDGGGIRNWSGNRLTVRSTILWGNSDAGGTDASAQIDNSGGGTVAKVSYSIIQGTNGSNLNADPLLGPLQDNGGPTLTRLPAADSPALDAGKCFGPVTEDQRGEPRPIDDPDTPNADGGDGCDIGAVELFGGELLPVELTAFTALADGPRVLLAWETASETNNAGFELQHFTTDDWQRLAWIDGHGTTEQAQTYTHTIDDLAPGRHRFRLRQIDYDGAFEYSPEVEVAIGMDTAYLMTAPYPNPFNPQTQLSLMVKRSQQVRVAVYDLLGRRVAVLHEGELAAEQAQALVFEGASLASGLYVIRAEGETFVAVQRVTLVK